LRRQIALYGIAIIFVVVMIIGGVFVSNYFEGINVFRRFSSKPTTDGEIEAIKNVNLLVLGIDDVDGSTRSDTILLVNLNSLRGSIHVLSVPRDTRLYIPDHGLDKLGHAYAYGGAALSSEVLSNLLQIPIHYYIKVDYKGFEKIINAVGGLTIDVEKDMKYTDNAGGLFIDIASGIQSMDGAEALKYVRYRDDTGDIGRISRQQKLMGVLAEKLLSVNMLPKLPTLLSITWGSFETDLSFSELTGLLGYLNSSSKDNLITVSLPGAPEYINKASYWVPIEKDFDEMVTKLFFGEGYPDVSEIRVKVVNGCGIAGIAGKVAEKLRLQGYNVVSVGNAEHFGYSKTIVLDKLGYPKAAKDIAEYLSTQVTMGLHYPNDDADITVIVGPEQDR
jgi:LCP family protein required for cell wall assembly